VFWTHIPVDRLLAAEASRSTCDNDNQDHCKNDQMQGQKEQRWKEQACHNETVRNERARPGTDVQFEPAREVEPNFLCGVPFAPHNCSCAYNDENPSKTLIFGMFSERTPCRRDG